MSVPTRASRLRGRLEGGGAAKVGEIVGRYRFVGGEAERAAREAAIDQVVSDMNVIVRGTARRRLAAASEIPAGLSLSLRGDLLTVRLPEGAYAAPLDGSVVKVAGPSGDPVSLRHQLVGDAGVRQHFDSDDGRRVNLCEPLADGRLRIHVTLHSPKLPKPLRYAMTFARV